MRVPFLAALVALVICILAPSEATAQNAGTKIRFERVEKALNRAESARQAGDCDEHRFMAGAAASIAGEAHARGFFSDEYYRDLFRHIARAEFRRCPPLADEPQPPPPPPPPPPPHEPNAVGVLEQMVQDARKIDDRHLQASQRCDRAAMERYQRQLDDLAAQARNVLRNARPIWRRDQLARLAEIIASIARHAATRLPQNCSEPEKVRQPGGEPRETGAAGTAGTAASSANDVGVGIVSRVVPGDKIAGTYQLSGPTGSRSQVTISESGGRLMLLGAGEPVALQQQDEIYIGSGASLFGRNNLQVSLRMSGSAPQLTATDQQGQIYTARLVAEPHQ